MPSLLKHHFLSTEPPNSWYQLSSEFSLKLHPNHWLPFPGFGVSLAKLFWSDEADNSTFLIQVSR